MHNVIYWFTLAGMHSLIVLLLINITSTTPVKADELSFEEANTLIDQAELAIELANNDTILFKSNEPLGRGIFDKKYKRLLRLYCVARNSENNSCTHSQYGVSHYSRTKKDANGNYPSVNSKTYPIGPVMSVSHSQDIKDKISNLKHHLTWRYRSLNFNLTKKAWKEGYLSGRTPNLIPWPWFIGAEALGGLAVLIGANPYVLITGPAYIGAPTIVDLGINTAKIIATPFITIERGLVNLLSKDMKKIANAMTATPTNWMDKAMLVSTKSFENTYKAIAGEL